MIADLPAHLDPLVQPDNGEIPDRSDPEEKMDNQDLWDQLVMVDHLDHRDLPVVPDRKEKGVQLDHLGLLDKVDLPELLVNIIISSEKTTINALIIF